jgi:hypothetical protein
MNLEQLYRDFNIPYVTEGHKHSRPGWINTECPFCSGNPGYHLGYDIAGNKFVCWRCGGHFAPKVIAKLCGVSFSEANTLLRQYGALVGKSPEIKRKVKIKTFKLPPDSQELTKSHRKYLISRGYDPDEIIKTWGILGTGIYSKMDNINYSRRLIIPYNWNGNMVSFDTRDITGTAQNKYRACSEIREEINHKHILYGKQKLWKDTGLCVEGTTDVWRLGVNSFAVSGIKYTPKQVRIIAKTFTRVPVIFDPEPQAKIQADKLVGELRFRGVDAFRVDIDWPDPGKMPQNEADYFVKQLI